jgi:hypothetical protein
MFTARTLSYQLGREGVVELATHHLFFVLGESHFYD